MALEFSRQILEKYSNIKFHEKPSSGIRVVTCGRTDMTKPIAASRNFASAPVNGHKKRTGHPNINRTATFVLGSGHPSVRCQDVTETHAMRHVVTTRTDHPGPSKSKLCGRPKIDRMR